VSFSEAQLRPTTQLQREHVPARVLSSLVITSVVTFAVQERRHLRRYQQEFSLSYRQHQSSLAMKLP